MLVNPANPASAAAEVKELQGAAERLGMHQPGRRARGRGSLIRLCSELRGHMRAAASRSG
jgi:hypothetical protein